MSASYLLLVSPAAIADLDEVSAFIGRDDPARARLFVVALRRKYAAIAARPAIYRVRPELAPDIRGAQLGRYIAVFRILEPDRVVRIERVLHGARDIRQLFEP